MKHVLALLLVLSGVFTTIACQKIDGDQPFVMTSPDAGNKTFGYKVFSVQENLLNAYARTNEANIGDVIRLLITFNNTGIGKKITLKGCSFGFEDVNGEVLTSKLTSGSILLKDKTEDRIVLRFKEVGFTLYNGDYRLNGDLTYELLKQP